MSIKSRDLTTASRLRIAGLIEAAEKAYAAGQYLLAANTYHIARYEIATSTAADSEMAEMLAHLAADALARFLQEAGEMR